MKLFTESIDIKNLENSIVKSVEADIDPFKKQAVIYTADIKRLRTKVENFVIKNLHKLTPV
jgi:hypothetical protein